MSDRQALDSSDPVLVLSGRDVSRLKPDFSEVVSTVRSVFEAQSRGEMAPVSRTVMGPPDGGRFMVFPGHLPSLNLSGLKWFSLGHYRDDGRPYPFSAHILLSDTRTGRLRALVDARWVTVARTVAVTVIATLRGADPESSTIGFFGCGEQSIEHLKSLADLFPFRKVLVVGRGAERIGAFIDLANSLGLDAEACDARRLLENSDIVVSAISSYGRSERTVDPAWARGGSFISLVDLGRAWKIAATGGPVIADDCEQFHYLRSIDRLHVLGEPMALSEVLGSDESVRSTDDPTVFVPTGYGAADLAIVELLVDAALRKGVGHSLSLD